MEIVEFINELGNEIHIAVSEQEVSGIEGVHIRIVGPSSETEMEVTRMEAEMLYEQLGIILNAI